MWIIYRDKLIRTCFPTLKIYKRSYTAAATISRFRKISYRRRGKKEQNEKKIRTRVFKLQFIQNTKLFAITDITAIGLQVYNANSTPICGAYDERCVLL